MKKHLKLSLVTTGLFLLTTLPLAPSLANAEDMPSQEEMWKVIQQQQKQITELKKLLGQTQDKVEKTEKVAEDTKKEVKKVSAAVGAEDDGIGGYFNSGKGGWWDRTHLGGYGELHYNGGDKDEIDFHRFVLFIGHEFNDRIRLFSELEVEHALSGDGKPGELELEQAFVEFDITENQQAKAGVFLLPVGILNETHEPPTFFGVERNPVEANIIPTTWWEGGVGLNGQLYKGFSYDVAFHSGLNTPTTGSNAFKIRNGRQKVASAVAKDGAVTGRIKWTGYPGVELAASGQYQQDVTQSALSEDIDATLFETHADIKRGGFGLRALYARWDLSGDAPKAFGRDEQWGWYVEPSYSFSVGDYGKLGFFARHNQWDNEAGLSGDTDFKQTDFGLNYWPHPDVVLKADFALLDAPAGSDDDEILNLGVGFQF